MKVFDAHLETALGAYEPTAQRDATRRELRSMMEDAHVERLQAGAAPDDAARAVIAAFGDLDELAPTLGLVRARDSAATAEPEPSAHPPVTLDEARRFAEASRRSRVQLAGAVAVFVAAPAPLAFLAVASDALGADAGTSIAIGLATLLVGATVGASLLVRRSSGLGPYARIRSRAFRSSPQVTRWADDLRRAHERRRSAMLAVAVALWIASPVPLLVVVLGDPDASQEPGIGAGVAGLLLAVAVGLFLLLSTTWARATAGLLEHGRAA